jgi:hypothetical protein
MNWICRHVDSTRAVTKDNHGRGKGNVEFLHLADPAALGNSVSKSLILDLNARPDTVVWRLETKKSGYRRGRRRSRRSSDESPNTQPNLHMNMRSGTRRDQC